jgi:hypothetical protein
MLGLAWDIKVPRFTTEAKPAVVEPVPAEPTPMVTEVAEVSGD